MVLTEPTEILILRTCTQVEPEIFLMRYMMEILWSITSFIRN